MQELLHGVYISDLGTESAVLFRRQWMLFGHFYPKAALSYFSGADMLPCDVRTRVDSKLKTLCCECIKNHN
jgi:hypothetical protein